MNHHLVGELLLVTIPAQPHPQGPPLFAKPRHWNTFDSADRLRRSEYLRDRGSDALVLGHLGIELFSSGSRQTVVASAPVVGRKAPLGDDPALDEKALEGGIQRA